MKKTIFFVFIVCLGAVLIMNGCSGKKTAQEKKPIKMATNVEFLERKDGIPALEKAYDFKFNRDAMVTMKTGLTYDALRNNKVDVGMGFATDGRIPAFNLINLKDDKNFFPVYNPTPIIRKEIIKTYPEIKEVINKLPPLLDQKTLAELNKSVDVDGKNPEEVAENFLKENNLLTQNPDKKEGPAVIVSSKPWTEQLILSHMLIDLLEAHGYPVKDRTSLGESPVLRKALKSGQIDLYWEYTGTTLMTEMGESEITEAVEAYNKVKEWDYKNNDIVWLDYAKANNTYTLMMKKDRAEELEVKTISDLANYINSNK